MRIFVVEDHSDSRAVLCLMLEQLGHEVAQAATVRESLSKLRDEHCDVLISDIGLPDGDGWELLRSLAPQSRPYAIAMSGYGTEDDQRRSHECGFRKHLVKPLASQQLESALEEAALETGQFKAIELDPADGPHAGGEPETRASRNRIRGALDECTKAFDLTSDFRSRR